MCVLTPLLYCEWQLSNADVRKAIDAVSQKTPRRQRGKRQSDTRGRFGKDEHTLSKRPRCARTGQLLANPAPDVIIKTLMDGPTAKRLRKTLAGRLRVQACSSPFTNGQERRLEQRHADVFGIDANDIGSKPPTEIEAKELRPDIMEHLRPFFPRLHDIFATAYPAFKGDADVTEPNRIFVHQGTEWLDTHKDRPVAF